VLFDLCERGALSGVVRVEAPTLVSVPAPGRPLDPIGVEDAKIGGEAIELALHGHLARHQRNANPLRPNALETLALMADWSS